MATITLRLDDREFHRAARKLSDTELPRAMAKALNRTSFEVLEAERAAAVRAFPGASPRGKRFFGTKSFKFDPANPGKLQTRIYPNPTRGKYPTRREEILLEHERGGLIFPSKRRLSLAGKLAVPIGPARVARQRTGKVPARYQPARILDEGHRGFIAGRAILLRQGRGRRSRAIAVFALVPSAQIDQRKFFYETAQRTAQREFPRKAREEFEKIRLG